MNVAITDEELFWLAGEYCSIDGKDDLPVLVRALRQVRHVRGLLNGEESRSRFENIDQEISNLIQGSILFTLK